MFPQEVFFHTSHQIFITHFMYIITIYFYTLISFFTLKPALVTKF